MEFKVTRRTALPSTGALSRPPVPAPLSPAAFDAQAVSQRDPAPGSARAGAAAASRGAGGEVGGEPSSGGKSEPGAERGTNPLVAHNLGRRLASP